MPRQNTETGRWEVSVFRVPGMTIDEVHDLGTRSFNRQFGFGEITPQDVEEAALTLDTRANELHADIDGWPEDKDDYLARALILSNAAKPRLAPTALPGSSAGPR